MKRLSLAIVLIACSSGREGAPLAAVDADASEVARLRADLAQVIGPEPAGHLEVRFTGRVEVSRVGQPGVSVSIAALDLPAARFRAVDGRTRMLRVGDTDIVHVASAGRFEELRRVRHALGRIELRYDVSLGPALSSLRVVDDRVEALDDRGVARLRTEPAFAVDARGRVRPLLPGVEGHTVSWSADASDLVPPIAIDPAWTTTASLVTGRGNAGIFPLPGKKLLIAGGSAAALGRSEIYDDATSSFTAGPALNKLRNNANAVRLDDGRVFLAGGASESPMTGEIFDPAIGSWKVTASYATTPVNVFTVALKSARALVMNHSVATIYDATTNTFVKTPGNPLTSRVRPFAAPLSDGRVLIAGGFAAGAYVSTAELFDPSTGSFSATGSFAEARRGATMLPLADGRVALIGGLQPTEAGTFLDSTEVFDPKTGTWSAGPKLLGPRAAAGAGLLGDGRVLLAGGNSGATLLSSAELLDFATKTAVAAGSLSVARTVPAFGRVTSEDPRLLAIGGAVGAYSRIVDVFQLQAAGKACAAAGECANGTCVDGVCCEATTCAADETCGGAASPGKCRKKDGIACATGDACASGACVDGFCCDRACDGVCEACDVATSKGTCTTLAPGESPRGKRAACPGDAPCRGLCSGVEATKCTLFPGAETSCAAATCVDGMESAAGSCNGLGACAVPAKVACEPFACGATSCKRACEADADCTAGYSCDPRTGRCVFGAKCDGSHTVIVPGGDAIDCTPFVCAGASCLSKCGSTGDCVAGTTCDTATGACVVTAAPAADEGGGCTMAARGRPPWALTGLLLGLLAVRRRRASC